MKHSCHPKLHVFSQNFLKIVVEVKASGPPYALKLWLGVSKGMLPVKYFCKQSPHFVSVKFHGDHMIVVKTR